VFDKSALMYDAIYSFKNYKQEADAIRSYILKYKPEARTVLDVACGTGKHIEHLSDDFAMDGVDLNEQFIQIAKDRNPNSNFWCADMTALQLGKKYDVVMCLYSSIAYVRTLQTIKKTVEHFANHTNDNGMILIEPWFTPDTWVPGYVSTINCETDQFKICRMSHADREGDLSIINFEYLIGSEQGIQHLKERHELGLFRHEELMDVFGSIGMKVNYDTEGISGRGLYLLS